MAQCNRKWSWTFLQHYLLYILDHFLLNGWLESEFHVNLVCLMVLLASFFPSGNFSEKKEILQMYSSFLVFMGMTKILLNDLPHHTRTMLCHKNVRFVVPKPRESCTVPLVWKFLPDFLHEWKTLYKHLHCSIRRKILTDYSIQMESAPDLAWCCLVEQPLKCTCLDSKRALPHKPIERSGFFQN